MSTYLPIPNKSDEPHNCPHCGVSLLGCPIHHEYAHEYSGNYWKREVGIEIPELYDGVSYYECPDCLGIFGGAFGYKGEDNED